MTDAAFTILLVLLLLGSVALLRWEIMSPRGPLILATLVLLVIVLRILLEEAREELRRSLHR